MNVCVGSFLTVVWECVGVCLWKCVCVCVLVLSSLFKVGAAMINLMLEIAKMSDIAEAAFVFL